MSYCRTKHRGSNYIPVFVPLRVVAVLTTQAVGADVEIAVESLVMARIVAFQPSSGVHNIRVDIIVAGGWPFGSQARSEPSEEKASAHLDPSSLSTLWPAP